MISAFARQPDHLDVFWIGPDGGIGSTWWRSGQTWATPFPIAPARAADAPRCATPPAV